MKILVSVVIPLYNHEKYIYDTLTSVCNQSLENIEIIVVDDGSTDQSYNIVSNYKDSRIRLFTQKNQGAHHALNRGISIANGECIAILNSDDMYTHNRLEKMYYQCSESKADLMLGSYIEIIDSKGKTIGIKKGYENCLPDFIKETKNTFHQHGNLIDNLFMTNYFCTTSNFFFKRSTFTKVGIFYPLRYVHDWDYLLRCTNICNIKIIDLPLLKYRIHPKNTIKENRNKMFFEICWVLASNFTNTFSKEEIFASLSTQSPVYDFSLFNYFIIFYNSVQINNNFRVLWYLCMLKIYCNSNNCDKFYFDLLEPRNPIHQLLVSEINSNLDSNKGLGKIILQYLRKILTF